MCHYFTIHYVCFINIINCCFFIINASVCVQFDLTNLDKPNFVYNRLIYFIVLRKNI